jgi:hypothetical protein
MSAELDVDSDVMWIAADEARAIGLHRSGVTAARRNPDHPAHPDSGGPRQAAGKSAAAPRRAIVAWWLGRLDRGGPGRPPTAATAGRVRALATELGIPAPTTSEEQQ